MRCCAGQRQGGFTLLELLLVLVLLGIALVAVSVNISRGLQPQARQDVAALLAGLRSVRSQAISQGQPLTLTVDPETRQWSAPGQGSHRLSAGLMIELHSAAQSPRQQGVYTFYPDGSASGGYIRLVRGGQRWRLDIDWLSGQIRQQQEQQP
ncbi:GspH/FimT family protein [Pokkaliibacter sp. MBI-7]|uniref:GspH/FimT family protein n=1 Tax=Pokkaliibacter sp. MBI-7 TaxID=3040600 RepID=UPI00244965BE|nr:GspH/FimT family protein [Pokkaliibacter sp. MBI-7]MDH2431074.1 GspH/FimT family protein [Pokkaliibacter sp. MBI-7]